MHAVAASYTQHYTPVADNLSLSALVAALPVIVLLGLLGLLQVRAHSPRWPGWPPRCWSRSRLRHAGRRGGGGR